MVCTSRSSMVIESSTVKQLKPRRVDEDDSKIDEWIN
ncbi:hypothetical protein MUDAN_BIHEEGNE_02264 [Lactiplantibacillus mudanjiangensis]|nr:hypothetical protein MUDAN_BIHEEGNE_02264 [Lactiplantibacillus mudanjiangensis]